MNILEELINLKKELKKLQNEYVDNIEKISFKVNELIKKTEGKDKLLNKEQKKKKKKKKVSTGWIAGRVLKDKNPALYANVMKEKEKELRMLMIKRKEEESKIIKDYRNNIINIFQKLSIPQIELIKKIIRKMPFGHLQYSIYKNSLKILKIAETENLTFKIKEDSRWLKSADTINEYLVYKLGNTKEGRNKKKRERILEKKKERGKKKIKTIPTPMGGMNKFRQYWLT